MITNKELNAVKLSPTKKDFYQIWNELLDTAGKISERWDPSSTNESDPGIVLLKVLTAVADKLNYNIDANTLEAFMPSAAQEDSMRKLTEMLGYNMKYYQSATTEVKISYTKNVESPISGILTIDKFTNIKDVDDSINYVTLEPLNLTSDVPFGNVMCMEGELVECETADNNIVSIFHLDDNKRYFLPETQIAENSIFITNIENNIEGTEWRKVANLNAQSLNSKVFKFGFDSQEGLPYIQFPEDISTIIEDGLRIKYIRTRGGDGNVSKDTLTKLTTPLSWTTIEPENKQACHEVNNFTVTNIRAATNGADKEGINAAYNNFKKTIGTFDTLVTCRDYMNKIYQLVSNTDNTTPLVSNVIVSDIKSDINRAVTLGTFTNRGIEYKVKAKPGKDFTNFDLMLYPFKSTYGLNSQPEFTKSFKYDNSNYAEILTDLEDTKTLAHNFVSPDPEELACIKNYYRLRAKINTVRKVGTIEQASILNNIYKKLFETFNMRQLDFGEEIPYDTLLNVIETADPRIKNISLDEPTLTTKFMSADNKEVDITMEAGKKLYNSLVLNNVLAGRVPLFNYNNDFVTDFNEKAYSQGSAASIYPLTNKDDAAIHKIVSEFEIPVEAISGKSLTLTDNEVIQFKAPSLTTTRTYPAYVNYYFIRNTVGTTHTKAIPATMQTLRDFLRGGPGATTESAKAALEYYINDTAFPTNLILNLEISSDIRNDQVKFKNRFDEIVSTNCAIFTKSGTRYNYVINSLEGWNLISTDKSTVFYTLAFDKSGSSGTGVSTWNTWLVNLTQVRVDCNDDDKSTTSITLDFSKGEGIKGFYKTSGGNLQGNVGYLIDQNGIQFKLVETPKDVAEIPFNYYYVPRFWVSNKENNLGDAKDWHTKNGLGQNAEPFELAAGVEYELKDDEYLLINWTQSKENNSDEKEEHWETHKKGDIIKPNFNLVDSAAWSEANHSYTKLNVASKFDVAPQLLGMFTLGTNEQIEVRELVQVTLNGANTNLYWERSDTVSTTGGYVEFTFDEDLTYFTDATYTTIAKEPTKYTKYMAYTLKEGEYLYYTDMNKSDIAFYGFGSTIRRGIGTPTIFKYTSDDVINTTEISTNGINASIPWRNYNLSGKNAELTITENQFINLTAGDTLEKVHLVDPGDFLNNEYTDIGSNGASWKFAGSESVTNLPVLDLADSRYKWQVRSKLNLSMGPNKPQTLQTKNIDISGATVQVKDKITLYNTLYDLGVGTDRKIVTLSATSPDYPLSIKANKFIQSSVSTTDVTDKKMSVEGELEEIIADLQLKLFEVETVKNNLGQILNFGNYGEGKFTTINFEEQLNQIHVPKNTTIDFDLNMLIPDNSFGLLMCYYQNLNTRAAAQSSHPKLITTNGDTVLSFFNESPAPAKELTLRPGINIIKIDSHTTVKLSTVTYNDIDTDDIDNDGNTTETVTIANNKVVVTFGMLDLIPKTDSINPKLNYQKINAATVYEQILMDIGAIDTENEFYYNMPISQNLDIDMNPNDEEDTLANPFNWFNYNNINNKFVIAEIDTERLTDDIVIAKSSRSNF
jgi:hypothetical protein